MSKEPENTVRKHLSEADILTLMAIRGMSENTFKPLKGLDPKVYRPRTTTEEWKAIKASRPKLEKAKKKKPIERVPSDAAKLIKRISGNSNLTKDEKFEVLEKHLEVDRQKLSGWAEQIKSPIKSSQFSKAKNNTFRKAKRYLISSAQNASPANKDLLLNMEAYADHIGAEIMIIATRYRNPTSVWHTDGEFWDEAVHPYLTASRHTLHKHLEVLGDLKVQATSPNPTNGIELFGDKRSCIVGAPKIEFRSLPVLPEQDQKFLYSTGSVTAPSFTESVAGGRAAEHHSHGFIVVEIESDDVVHCRNVSAHKDGTFNDLIFRVEGGEVATEEVPIMVFGDSHFAQKDESVTKAFRGVCSDLSVSEAILHDVYDSESLNLHNIKDPIVQSELQKAGRDSIDKEIDQMHEELLWFEERMKKTIVVGSNHDDFLSRAMTQGDWRDNIKNARTFVRFLGWTLDGLCPDGIVPYIINGRYKNIQALGVNDSYIKYGIELGMHGHKGANGSRGNVKAMAKLSTKSVIGHSHTPSITGGCYQVGISCAMDHGYNKGLSGWAYASCIINGRGKRQMIVLNKWTKSYTTLL